MVRLTLALILIALPLPLLAQDAAAIFTADKASPLIGEPVELTLIVRVPIGSVVTMPSIPIDWPPLTIIRYSPVSTTEEGAQSIYHQVFTVVLWKPGDYQTPKTTVTYQLPGALQSTVLVIQPTLFTVPRVLSDADLTLRPLKPPLEISYLSPRLVGLASLFLIALLILTVIFFRSRMKLARLPKNSPFSLSAQIAFRELRRIHERGNLPAEMYVQTADCIRNYVRECFQIHAEDMTTVEIKNALAVHSSLPESHQREVAQLLERADLVKFAPLQAEATSAQRFVVLARKWIQSVEQKLETEVS